MGLSVSSMNPISSVSNVTTTPQMYAVSNESQISSSFEDSMKINNTGSVFPTIPVQYPTAMVTENTINQIQSNQTVNQAYNNLAASFTGLSTGYDANSNANAYNMVGSNLDVFA